ncbi:MAG: ATP phosphoribosyltransferase regulatory subunit [Cyanobacteriota/Melainabacteria group bacterium]
MAKQETLKATPPRGTRDFLPEEAALRDWACEKIKATYREHGFTPIETPALENIKLLKRGEGGENLQLIFEILKRGEKLEKAMSGNGQEPELSDLGLRFDLTVPLVRYYSNNANELPIPFKAVQIGNVWRAERPQKGRFRQFTQCDIDIIGLKSNFAELDLLNASSRALLALGLDGFTIRINDRRYLQDIARYCGFAEESWERVFIAIDKLDKIGLDGVKTELLQENPGQEKAVEKLGEIFNTTDELRSDTTISGSEQIEKMRGLLPDTESKRTARRTLCFDCRNRSQRRGLSNRIRPDPC